MRNFISSYKVENDGGRPLSSAIGLKPPQVSAPSLAPSLPLPGKGFTVTLVPRSTCGAVGGGERYWLQGLQQTFHNTVLYSVPPLIPEVLLGCSTQWCIKAGSRGQRASLALPQVTLLMSTPSWEAIAGNHIGWGWLLNKLSLKIQFVGVFFFFCLFLV